MPGTSNSGGRNAKSTQMHLIKGTFRGDRHGDHTTPEAPVGDPIPPKSLTPAAKAEWLRMVDRMKKTGTLTLVDDGALYQYAQLHAETERLVEDHAELRKELENTRKLSLQLRKSAQKLDGAELVEAIKSIVKLSKVMVEIRGQLARETQQLRQGHMALRMYLVEFGMTPAARTRVKLPGGGKPKQSKLAQLMGKQA